MTKTIVCDTGPILHLTEAGLLDILSKTGKIYIPARVHIELKKNDIVWEEQKPSWVFVETLSDMETFRA